MKPKTPIRSIRAYCLSCSGDSANEVRLCVCPQCSLYPYRMGKRPGEDNKYQGELLTPVKAIRSRCIDCSGFILSEVRRCFLPECSLYPYRMGKNPNCRRTAGKEEVVSSHSSRKTLTKLPTSDAETYLTGLPLESSKASPRRVPRAGNE